MNSSAWGGDTGARTWPLAWDRTRPGWLLGARRVLSPNHDLRPPGAVIDAIVVHGISLPPGEFGGPDVERLFTNRLAATDHPTYQGLDRLRVSAHWFVRRSGELVQFVASHHRAWHAGVSTLAGRERCNDFSVGIELEGTDRLAYEDAQYATLAALVVLLRARYPAIAADRVVGHSDVAPGRKTDPGPAFDWQRLRIMTGP